MFDISKLIAKMLGRDFKFNPIAWHLKISKIFVSGGGRTKKRLVYLLLHNVKPFRNTQK